MIALCLRAAGIGGQGQTPNAAMVADSANVLEDMISEWREDSLLIYRILDLSTPVTGAASYTVGPGADFPTAVRPEDIEGAYIRQTLNPTQPVDYYLTLFKSRVDFARITLKNLTAAPSQAVWYDPAFPEASLYPWPVPVAGAGWELHILIRELLDSIPTDLTDPMGLPPVYYRAVYNNLAVDLGNHYRRPPMPLMVRRAQGSLRQLRRINTKLPLMRLPAGLRTGPRYNIISDRGN